MDGRLRLGRNDLCWCKSGRKYKRCHLDRESQPRLTRQEALENRNREFTKAYCSHPAAGPTTCKRPIVRAHSLRRARDLSSIADHGHVVQITADFSVLDRTGGMPEAKLIGVNQASTFPGFCSRHDNDTFIAVEQQPFGATPEQCFLFFYRVWCKEAYGKEAQARTAELLREGDRGLPVHEQIALQGTLGPYLHGLSLGVRDVRKYKLDLDTALLKRDFEVIQSTVFRFKARLPLVAAGAFYPYNDLDGRVVQAFSDQSPPQPMAVTLLNEGQVGVAILSWFAHASESPTALLSSVQQADVVSDALFRLVTKHCENVFMSPTWWNSISQEHQQDAIRRLGNSINPFEARSSDDLIRPLSPTLTVEVDTVVAV